jgi:hypothetical protein
VQDVEDAVGEDDGFRELSDALLQFGASSEFGFEIGHWLRFMGRSMSVAYISRSAWIPACAGTTFLARDDDVGAG